MLGGHSCFNRLHAHGREHVDRQTGRKTTSRKSQGYSFYPGNRTDAGDRGVESGNERFDVRVCVENTQQGFQAEECCKLREAMSSMDQP